jgi:hypothetical protein
MGFNKGISANINISSGNNNPPTPTFLSKEPYQVGRVKDIILDENYPEIEKYGGLNGIGTIRFELINDPSIGEGFAKPLYPQNSSYPLVNELILIFKLPNNNIGKTNSATSSYYINMISLWNHPHHNAYPNPKRGNPLPPQQNKDYQETEAGSVRRVTDSSTEINLNSPTNPYQNTFLERTNIHPLLPFPGDIITQGRWGNSIRFGSTAKPFNLPSSNKWSSTGTNGDPITIIRNGQSSNFSDEGWIPVTENINEDKSSIYATSTQKIPIKVATEKYYSYKTPPTIPSQYTNPQVIINSDRLVFNAKTDNILLSAEKSIGLSSVNSLNFDTKNYIVDAGSIKLGSKNATEPLVKGETLYKNLNQIVNALITLVDVMEVQQLWSGGVPTPDGATSVTARTTKDILNHVKKDLVNIKSKVSKTV